MSTVFLPNNLNDTIMIGNLDLYGNVNVNSQNVYLGYLAGNANPGIGSGIDVGNMKNVAIGASCATYQTGMRNVSIGYDAATNDTTTYSGSNNVSIGYNSGFNSSVASNGVALGANSLIDFSGSIAIGSSATATGFRNIAIGASAFSTGNTSSIGNSIAIGVGASTLWYGNSVAIGFGATSTANNQFTLGTTNDRLSFPGMRSNYLFVSDAAPAGVAQTVNSIVKILFRTTVDDCPSLLEKQSDNYTFKNVSGRPIICIATFSICISFTNAPNYSSSYFLYNSVSYGTYTVYKPVSISNDPTRISTTAILPLAVNESFSCWSGSIGNSNNGKTLTTASYAPTLSVFIF
jgi:hypothetical protein